MTAEQGLNCHHEHLLSTCHSGHLDVISQASAAPPPAALSSEAHRASLRVTPLLCNWCFPRYLFHLSGVSADLWLPLTVPHITSQKVSIEMQLWPHISQLPNLLIFMHRSPWL